jgi:hypothetical protein
METILGTETMESVQLTRMSRLDNGHGLVSSFPFTMISGSTGFGFEFGWGKNIDQACRKSFFLALENSGIAVQSQLM